MVVGDDSVWVDNCRRSSKVELNGSSEGRRWTGSSSGAPEGLVSRRKGKGSGVDPGAVGGSSSLAFLHGLARGDH